MCSSRCVLGVLLDLLLHETAPRLSPDLSFLRRLLLADTGMVLSLEEEERRVPRTTMTGSSFSLLASASSCASCLLFKPKHDMEEEDDASIKARFLLRASMGLILRCCLRRDMPGDGLFGKEGVEIFKLLSLVVLLTLALRLLPLWLNVPLGA